MGRAKANMPARRMALLHAVEGRVWSALSDIRPSTSSNPMPANIDRAPIRHHPSSHPPTRCPCVLRWQVLKFVSEREALLEGWGADGSIEWTRQWSRLGTAAQLQHLGGRS